MKIDSETIQERPDLENIFDVETCTNFLRYEWTARFLCKSLPKNAKILEVGMGFGWGTKKLHDLGFEITGIDYSEEAISTAQARYPNLHFIKADAENFVLSDTFDAIVALEVLEHIPDWLEALENWESSLKPDGWLILSVPNRPYNSENPFAKKNPFHLKEFTFEEMKKILPGCKIRGMTLCIFKSRWENFFLRTLFFIIAILCSPFQSKKFIIEEEERGNKISNLFSRRELAYANLGWNFPFWSAGL